MVNVSAATNSNIMSTSYHLRVEGISAVRFPPGSCLNFRGELTHICSVQIREKPLRKKSLLLVINMAFADAILEAVSMPLYVFLWIGPTYWLWNYRKKLSLDISWSVVDATFTQGLLISAAAIAFRNDFTPYTGR